MKKSMCAKLLGMEVLAESNNNCEPYVSYSSSKVYVKEGWYTKTELKDLLEYLNNLETINKQSIQGDTCGS